MRREEPNRHGRAADALIASYVRELLAEDEADAAPTRLAVAPGEPSAAVLPPSPDPLREVEATL
jgi:hypothetical protein